MSLDKFYFKSCGMKQPCMGDMNCQDSDFWFCICFKKKKLLRVRFIHLHLHEGFNKKNLQTPACRKQNRIYFSAMIISPSFPPSLARSRSLCHALCHPRYYFHTWASVIYWLMAPYCYFFSKSFWFINFTMHYKLPQTQRSDGIFLILCFVDVHDLYHSTSI